MTITINSRTGGCDAFSQCFWRFYISSADAAQITANPYSLNFITAAGVTNILSIYDNTSFNNYQWSVSYVPSEGSWLLTFNFISGTIPFFSDNSINDIESFTLVYTAIQPNTVITYQPQSAINSAYRPIVFRCKVKTGNPKYIAPVVYCDIYVNTIYYKTLAKTQFIANDGVAPEYEFDIQDALQELMVYEIPKADGHKVETFYGGVKNVFIRIRNAIVDSNNFTVSAQTSPVMATSSSPAQSGAGTQSASIVVVNTLIQHEEEMNMGSLLNSYKTGTWEANSFPLTKRPEKHILGLFDSSHFPILTNKRVKTLCIVYKTKFSEATFCADAIVENEEPVDPSGGEGSPPVVFVKWNDTLTSENRSCTASVCNFVISVDRTDPDGDITNTEVFRSNDLGVNWISLISDLGPSASFGDSINAIGEQWYKAVVTDAESHIVESNILKYSKSAPSYPTYNYYYKAIHPEGHSGQDTIEYIDDRFIQ